MKLRLIFIIMDLLTALAYPIVYMHGRLRQYLKPKEVINLADLFLVQLHPADDRLDIMHMRKKGIYAYSND